MKREPCPTGCGRQKTVVAALCSFCSNSRKIKAGNTPERGVRAVKARKRWPVRHIWSEPITDDMRRLGTQYTAGESTSFLADAAGVSTVTILNWLRLMQIPLRPRGRPARLSQRRSVQ